MKCAKCEVTFEGIMGLFEHVCRRNGESATRTAVMKSWEDAFAAAKGSGRLSFSVSTLAGLVLHISKGDLSIAKDRISSIFAYIEKIEKEETPVKPRGARGPYKKKEHAH